MSWIEPLEMQQWIVNVFSGSSVIFLAIALLAIIAMAGYFKMNGLVVFFMVGLFLMMFSYYFEGTIYFMVTAFGALLIGYWIKSLVVK